MNLFGAARAAVGLVLVAACGTTLAQALSEVEFPSLDTQEGRAVQLKAYWAPAPQVSASASSSASAHADLVANSVTPAPAVVLLHGCGGLYDRQGRVSERMRDYAALLNAQGLHALLVDSLTPRGEREICTQRVGTRHITQAHRRLDALAALRWLSARPEVDARRLGLMGWSNGGSAVLASTNLQHREVKDFSPAPAFAVAFYPGCASDLKRGYRPSAPLLMLVGEADDWTPAAPCHELAAQAAQAAHAEGGKPVVIEGYPGAYHGFDSAQPVRLRRDVPNGAHPGQGVHVGGQPEALQRSRERLLSFLQAFR